MPIPCKPTFWDKESNCLLEATSTMPPVVHTIYGHCHTEENYRLKIRRERKAFYAPDYPREMDVYSAYIADYCVGTCVRPEDLLDLLAIECGALVWAKRRAFRLYLSYMFKLRIKCQMSPDVWSVIDKTPL